MTPEPQDSQRVKAAEKWLHQLAESLKLTYQQLLDACEARYKDPGQGNGWFPSMEIQEASLRREPTADEIETMWLHWEVITGKRAKSLVDSPFVCSC